MPTEIKMPALSPTMEEGTLARWLVKPGDSVRSGDLLAEIETDKATMEFEAVDEGTIASIDVAEGTDGVKVGTVIATLNVEGADASEAVVPPAAQSDPAPVAAVEAYDAAVHEPRPAPPPASPASSAKDGSRVKASPLARRIAAEQGVDLSALTGSGPNGRIVKADVAAAGSDHAASPAAAPVEAVSAPAAAAPSEAKPIWFDDTIPHIYLTLDVRLDALLTLRGELNAALAARGVKLSVNDLLIKALGLALVQVPKCNVTFAGDQLISYSRADVSVAVSTPAGLITPIVRDAAGATVSTIATTMKDLAERARDNKLKPDEYQGGTASLSNMGMFGIKQFDAVINPPQGMILAVGAGEPRPHVVAGALQVATIMTATGSFDHRAIDGADGAQLMQAFKALVEAPLGLLA